MSALFDRFRRNKGKVQAGCPAQMPATSSVWPEDKRDTLGLRSLYEPSDPQAAIVDIVFVHGLTGNSYTTWLHENGCHWPEKLLPEDIPDSRILSFGYDADVARFWAPASGNTVANHAQNLLGALSRLRGRTDTEDRKIIFVAHSLGGLVTKNALWLSSGSAEHHIRNVGSHTIGIAFLGTPHHGADLAAWATFGSRISQIVKKSNTEILAVLKPGSEVLAAIENGFGNQLRIRNDQDFDITCFYEELPLPLVGDVVPKHSAIMEGRSSYGIHANHMSMTKFAHSKNQGYLDVSGELFRWVKDVRKRKKAVFEDCLESFKFEEMDSQTRRPSKQPASAYDWIWTRPDTAFPEWIYAGRGIFWISGKPGSGKSTIMRQIVGNLTDGHAAVQSSTERVRRITASYFFDFSSSELARSPSAAFNTIIYQLLSQEPSFAKPVLPVYEKTKATKTEFKWDMEYLHRCVSEIFRSFTDIVFLVIIDALDESSMESFDLAEMFVSLAKEFPTNLQICVSSRPIIGFTDQFSCFPRMTMEDQTTADITRYTDSRFHELIDCQRSKTRDLVAAVVDKSEGIFLWVKLVNDILIRASRRGEDLERLRQRLKTFPKDLNAFYQRMLDDLDPEDHEEGRTMLAIVTSAAEPLSPLDLRRAVHLSLGVYTDVHNTELASRRVMAVCSGLLEIRGSEHLQVHLAHETVKSFLSFKRDILKWTSLAGALTSGNVLLLKASILLLQELATSYGEIQQARSYKLAEWHQQADPFLVYAVKWWVLHAQRSEREIGRAPSILRQFQPFQYAIWRQLFTDSPWMLRYEGYEHSGPPTEDLEELQKLYEGIPNTLQELVVSLSLPLVARDLLEYRVERDSGEVLYAAAKSGNLAIARMILERNTRIDRMSPLGRYSLCRAVYFGQIQIARLLLKHGADPNAPAVYWRDLENTPLQVAVRTRNKELIELLAEFGADLNGQDANHVTALTAAAQQGDADLVELLTRLGANVNVSEDSEGLGSALGAAIRTPDQTSRPTMIATLLQRGADPNAIQPHNDVPLIWAAVESCDIQAVESLIHHGAKLNLVDANGHTILYKVISMFKELRYASLKEIGRALITNGARFNQVDCTILALDSRPDYSMSTEQTMVTFEQTLAHGRYSSEASSSRDDGRNPHLQGLRVTNLLALRGSTPHMWDYVRAQNTPSPAPRTYAPPKSPSDSISRFDAITRKLLQDRL